MRNSLIGPIIFISLLVVVIPTIFFLHKRADEKYENFYISGHVEDKVYRLDGERGFYLFMNQQWFNIVNNEVKEYIAIGDSIQKTSGNNCFVIYRNNLFGKEICDSKIHEVKNYRILYKLKKQSE